MMANAREMGDAWDRGYEAGAGGHEFTNIYNRNELQRCYRQGYDFGRSYRAARMRTAWDERIHEYPLSDHDMTAIAEILDDVIARDEYHDTDHLRNLRDYLFEG